MTTTGGFAEATAVERVGDGGSYRAEIGEGWDIAGNTNGGYLLAIVGRALADATGRPDPVTLTAHYLAPGKPGPATVDTAVVRSGRRFATATATLSANGQPVLTALGTFGTIEPGDHPTQVTGGPPDLPDVDSLTTTRSGDRFPPPFHDRVDLRLHPDDADFASAVPGGGEARMRGWFRLRDGEPLDTIALLCAADSLPPAIFNAGLAVGWTPTIELTVHIRHRPAPGWLACAFTTRFIDGGFLEEDGEIWDTQGRLVAQSRQLALVPRGTS